MNRIPSLDVLRAIAVLLVIANHYPYFNFFYRVGWAGVDLFFVLSGFLISGLLFAEWKKNSQLPIGRFFVRRGLKIYPPFYVFLFATLVFSAASPAHAGQVSRRLLSECLFMQDYIPRLWPHTWSLGVEEKFYLALPFVLLGLSRLHPSSRERGFRYLPAISLLLIGACLAMRLQQQSGFYRMHLRVDALFAGVALGYWHHFRDDSLRKLSHWWFLPLGLALLFPVSLLGFDSHLAWVMTFNTAAFSLLLCWSLSRNLRFAPLEKIGFYSYSIYLWHVLVVLAVRSILPLSFFGLCLSLALSCLAGVISARLVERPALAIRERWFPADAAGMDTRRTQAARQPLPSACRAEPAR